MLNKLKAKTGLNYTLSIIITMLIIILYIGLTINLINASVSVIAVLFILSLGTIFIIRYYDSLNKWYRFTLFYSLSVTVIFTGASTLSALLYFVETSASISFSTTYLTTIIFNVVQLPLNTFL